MTAKLDLKNKIINGAMDFWQRGASAVTVSNSYTADRWAFVKSMATSTFTVGRSTDIPTTAFGQASLWVRCQAAQASVASSEYAYIEQRIEGNILRTFASKKMVLKFWVKSSVAGTYSVAFKNSASSKTLTKTYTINSANTWEQKTIRMQHDASGTWAYDTGIGLRVYFTLCAGTSQIISAGSWQNGDFAGAIGQANFASTLSNDFLLTDVVMVEDNDGQTRNPDFMYAGRTYFEELALCRRYFSKSFRQDIAAANNLTILEDAVPGLGTYSTSASFNTFGIVFPQVMRIPPSVTYYNPFSATLNTFAISGAGANAISAYTVSTYSITFRNNAAVSSGGQVNVCYTADAEL